MNHKTILMVALIFVVSSLACSVSVGNINFNQQVVKGSGTGSSESRSIQAVEGVELSGVGDLAITYGNEEKLEVAADENILPYLTSEVRNGTLHLGVKDGINLRPIEPIRYSLTVTLPLNQIEVSGFGNIDVTKLDVEQVGFGISGSGNIQVGELNAEAIKVEISGLGSLRVSQGDVGTQTIEISGSGAYQAADVKSEKAALQISGLGSATVWVTGQLDAKISGSGDISYYGNPQVHQEISGLGSLKSKGNHNESKEDTL